MNFAYLIFFLYCTMKISDTPNKELIYLACQFSQKDIECCSLVRFINLFFLASTFTIIASQSNFPLKNISLLLSVIDDNESGKLLSRRTYFREKR